MLARDEKGCQVQAPGDREGRPYISCRYDGGNVGATLAVARLIHVPFSPALISFLRRFIRCLYASSGWR